MKRGLRNGLRVERVQAGGRAREEGEKSPLRFLFFFLLQSMGLSAGLVLVHHPSMNLA